MKLSMTGQEKGDLLRQVTAWAGLAVFILEIYSCAVVFLYNTMLLQFRGLIREMASFEGDNLVVFYYLSASEIWPDKKGVVWWE